MHVSHDMAMCDTPSVALQLEKGLEDTARRRAAAHAITFFCTSTRLDFQEHVPSLLTVSFRLRSGAPIAALLGLTSALVYKDRIPSQGALCSRW